MAGSLDASTLEALSNKGLLRRAQKDLEREVGVTITCETEDTLFLRAGEHEVTLQQSGPASAKCSCPALGICQHILMAILFLQKPVNGDGAHDDIPIEKAISVEEQIAGTTRAQLEQWSGKSDFRKGLKIALQFTPEIIRDQGFRIRFAVLNAEVHYIPGAGLDGAFVSGGKVDNKPLIVAAIVGFQRHRGITWEFPEDLSAMPADQGAPRTRAEVLQSSQVLLQETLMNGLSRVSSGNQQRWTTLAVSALGVHLPRLALLLRGVGDEVSLLLGRNSTSDSMRLLNRMGQTYALSCALQNNSQNPRADLVGEHRSRYEEIGNLDLVSISAWPWKTASGYKGLTLLFWDSKGSCWNSWSDSRPKMHDKSFEPVARYAQPGPWEGCNSPSQLAHHSFRIHNARRSSTRRLSSSTKTRVILSGPVNIGESQLPVVDDWSKLLVNEKVDAPLGLKESNLLDAIVVIKPALWGERNFNAITQQFVWRLSDSKSHEIFLQLDFDEFAEPALTYLEKVPIESLAGALVAGRLEITAHQIKLHPFSVIPINTEPVHLFLDKTTSMVTTNQNGPSELENEELDELEEEIINFASSPTSVLARVLNELDDQLLAMAESGIPSQTHRIEKVHEISLNAKRIGLEQLSICLDQLTNTPKSEYLLRSVYLSSVHRNACRF